MRRWVKSYSTMFAFICQHIGFNLYDFLTTAQASDPGTVGRVLHNHVRDALRRTKIKAAEKENRSGFDWPSAMTFPELCPLAAGEQDFRSSVGKPLISGALGNR